MFHFHGNNDNNECPSVVSQKPPSHVQRRKHLAWSVLIPTSATEKWETENASTSIKLSARAPSPVQRFLLSTVCGAR
jgi:hypothetical protein